MNFLTQLRKSSRFPEKLPWKICPHQGQGHHTLLCGSYSEVFMGHMLSATHQSASILTLFVMSTLGEEEINDSYRD